MRLLSLALIATVLTLSAPGPCLGLEVPAPRPRAQLSFVANLRPALTVDMATSIPIGGPKDQVEPSGLIRHHDSDWMLGLAGGAGITFSRPRGDAVTPTAFAQAGILKLLAGDQGAFAGLVMVGWVRPEALGPAARFGIGNVVGAQLGWLFVRDHPDGVQVSIDASFALIRDLFIHGTPHHDSIIAIPSGGR